MKDGFIVAAAVIVQLACGVLAQLVVVRVVGAGPLTDAFLAAAAAPAVIFAVVTSAMQAVWLPRLAVSAQDGQHWRNELATANGQCLALCLASQLPLWIASRLWMPLIFPGFDAAQLDLASQLLGPLCLSNVCASLSAVVLVGLRTRGRFVAGELIAAATSVGALALTAWTVPRWGVMAATWTLAARGLVTYLAHVWIADRPGTMMAKAMRDTKAWHAMSPTLLSASLTKTAPLVDRFWASQAGAGFLTVLALASLAMGALMTVIERAIVTRLTPELARSLAASRAAEALTLIRRCDRQVLAITAGSAAVVFLAGTQLQWLLQTTLRLEPSLARSLWVIVLLLHVFVYAGAASSMLVAGMHAIGQSRIAATVGMAGFLLSLGVKAAGFWWLGLPGVAVGIGVHYLGNYIALRTLIIRNIHARLS